MTTAIKLSETQCSQVSNYESLLVEKNGREFNINDTSIDILDRMIKNQRIFKNYIDNQKIENLRNNYISWLFIIAPRLNVSKHTVFNTISMIDNLFSKNKNEEKSFPKNFQLLAVVCFFLSHKFYEMERMQIEFVANRLLHGNWSHNDICQAEIYILEKLDYQINFTNFYIFNKFFEVIITNGFDKERVKQIKFLTKYIMQKAIKLKELIFDLLPFHQVIIILNTTFLLLQQLSDFEIEKHSSFFEKITTLTSNQQINEFEKYSTILINNLSFSLEIIEKFNNINCKQNEIIFIT